MVLAALKLMEGTLGGCSHLRRQGLQAAFALAIEGERFHLFLAEFSAQRPDNFTGQGYRAFGYRFF